MVQTIHFNGKPFKYNDTWAYGVPKGSARLVDEDALCSVTIEPILYAPKKGEPAVKPVGGK